MVGVVALCLVGLEGVSRLLLLLSDARRARKVPPLSKLAVYRDVPWAADYWREWQQAVRLPERMRYTGDGILHLEPFRGTAINIDSSGRRRTTHVDCRAGALQIAMFGGSMLWGHGADDEHTIPSLIARRFENDGHSACITNDAEWGSTTSRGIIELLRELEQRQQRPNVVIFYSGSYDVKETIFGNEMDNWLRSKPEGEFAIQKLLSRLRARQPGEFRLAAADVARVRLLTVARFSASHRTIEALASEYHFLPVIVWHPYILASHKALSPDERATVDAFDQNFPTMAAAIRETYASMKAWHGRDFYDLSDALDGRHELLYIDAGHLAPAGNAIIADRIYEILSHQRVDATHPAR